MFFDNLRQEHKKTGSCPDSCPKKQGTKTQPGLSSSRFPSYGPDSCPNK